MVMTTVIRNQRRMTPTHRKKETIRERKKEKENDESKLAFNQTHIVKISPMATV